MRQIFAQKLPKIYNIPIQNAIIQIVFNISTDFFLFLRESISDYHDFKKKGGHRIKSWSE